MCFSAKNKSSLCIYLQIDGEAIAEINKSKFLGMIIGNKWCRKDHKSFVGRKVARGIGVIIKARKVLHSDSMKCFYYSLFIYPHMIYCESSLGICAQNKCRTPTHFTERGYKDYSRCSTQVSFRAIVYYIEVSELWKYIWISHGPSNV